MTRSTHLAPVVVVVVVVVTRIARTATAKQVKFEI
jgi:hypothetical protein